MRNLPSEKKYLSTRDTWIKIIFKKQWNLRKQCIYFQIIPKSIHMFHLIWLASVFRNVTCLHLFYSRTFIPNTHKFHFKSTNSGLQSSLFYFRIAMSCTIFSGVFFFFSYPNKYCWRLRWIIWAAIIVKASCHFGDFFSSKSFWH